ncbi:MAG: 1,4-dihydroxy-2-naphthoate polyprenyltransferase [Actinomycetota bacterium]|nr:1,4-dihydroxy-2-naphthoate polyprenyltransferase [Actinomycetota bacterium]
MLKSKWIAGARPRTLPAAIVPVVVGSAAARGDFNVVRALLAAIVALAIQIATNYANDYSDGKRGTDDKRVGPMRLVASGSATAKQVLLAAMAAFAVAGVAGAILAILTTPLLFVVGAVAIAAGWYYTGGKHPYGYYGFGELFVFIFFGLVAVVGTYYVQAGHVTFESIVLGSASGLLAVSLLVVNNVRDIDTDKISGKRTLAVRLGDRNSRIFYTLTVLVGILLPLALIGSDTFVLLVILLVPISLPLIRKVIGGAKGRELIEVLGGTGKLQLAFALTTAVALIL